MVKSSVLVLLILGVIYAQTISCEMLKKGSLLADSDDDDLIDSKEEASDAGNADEGNSDVDDETEPEPEPDSPALLCLLFGNLGCDTACSTTASAFSTESTGQCTDENICQCTLQQDQSLEGLFRAKFRNRKAKDILKNIKNDEDLAAKVLQVFQIPFQTTEQTKRQLKNIVLPSIYDQLLIDDRTPAWEADMVSKNDELNRVAIKKYVNRILKPVLQSSADALKDIDYKSKLNEVLKNIATVSDKDLQSIINEVRLTDNQPLINVVNGFLMTHRDIRESHSSEKENIFDVISHLTVNQFVNRIDQLNKLAANKSTSRRQPVKRTVKRSTTDDKKIPQQEEIKPIDASKVDDGKTSKQENNITLIEAPPKQQSSPAPENVKENNDVSSDDRFELSGFDKDFLKKYKGAIDETFTTNQYTVHYQRSKKGDVYFTWKKGTDEVEMTISLGFRSVTQNWNFGDAKITLHSSSSGNYVGQTWDFGKSKYTYNNFTGGRWSKKPAKSAKDDKDTLKKYQDLIAEWCDKNYFLVGEKEDCIIY